MATDPEPAKFRKPITHAVAALALAAALVAIHLSTLPSKLRYPGELNFIEGMPLAEMVHLRQGVPIYAPVSARGYDATNFGPLYYLLGARLIDPQQPAYLPLRILSLLATFGCATLAAVMAYGLARSYLAAALAPLIFVSYGFVFRHGVSARSDAVALALVFAGFVVAHRFRDSRALLWAAPLMLTGFYYKQQFVAGPLAVLVYLLLEKRYRLAAQFTGIMIAGGLVMLGLFQYVIFSGQSFLHHFVLYNVLPFTTEALISGIGFFAMILLVPLLVSLEYLRLFPDRLLKCYLLCAFALSLVTVARAGSDTYYFLECTLICSVLFAALFARRVAERPRAVELLVLLVVALFVGQWFRTLSPGEDNFRQDETVQKYLRRHFPPGTTALSYYAGDMIRAGLALPFTNLYHYNQLVRKGTVSEREMVGLLKNHHFGVVALDFDLEGEGSNYYTEYYMTESIRSAVAANYELSATMAMPAPEKLREAAKFYIWVPRPGSAGRAAAADEAINERRP